jgi:ubiquinone/menaquinone biosynthesis C-methylase UbiE
MSCFQIVERLPALWRRGNETTPPANIVCAVSQPRKSPDFNTLADDYAKFRTSYSDELFDAILEYAKVPARGRVLDVACGTGLGMLPYVRRGFDVCGVDVAPAMIDEARKSLPPNARAEFLMGRAEALPVSDASFDLVSCAQAFHWFEPHAAFAECARVLRPGGALAIFWKHAASGDVLTQTCENIVCDWLGEEAVRQSRDHADEHEAGWPVFWQYVAASGDRANGRLFEDGRKEVIEFLLSRTATEFVGYQRSREKIRVVLDKKRDQFLTELEGRLRNLGPMDQPVQQRQIQYVFLARKRG